MKNQVSINQRILAFVVSLTAVKHGIELIVVWHFLILHNEIDQIINDLCLLIDWSL